MIMFIRRLTSIDNIHLINICIPQYVLAFRGRPGDYQTHSITLIHAGFIIIGMSNIFNPFMIFL